MLTQEMAIIERNLVENWQPQGSGKGKHNMKVFNIFSKRQKRLRGEFPDVYQYDIIPEGLRVQVLHIWDDTLGRPGSEYFNSTYPGSIRVYEYIHNVLKREYRKQSLGNLYDSDFESIANFFLATKDAEQAIDVIELSFQCIDRYARHQSREFKNPLSPDYAIAELNHRFQEHGVGYWYESEQIIRVDSEFIHSEAVKPALRMLSNPMYKGANQEFLTAHEHYRAKRYEECMNECLKAFESCIKAICTKRRWKYKETDPVSSLIAIVFDNELIPIYMQSHFTSLRSTLESGLPTARNRQSGHGQGVNIIVVPDYMAAYALHLTASDILLLAKADEDMK